MVFAEAELDEPITLDQAYKLLAMGYWNEEFYETAAAPDMDAVPEGKLRLVAHAGVIAVGAGATAHLLVNGNEYQGPAAISDVAATYSSAALKEKFILRPGDVLSAEDLAAGGNVALRVRYLDVRAKKGGKL